MLAQLARELPEGDLLYEPKWDGMRCLAVKQGGAVELYTRNQRPIARYFPEVVEAVASLNAPSLILDGELVVPGPEGLDFGALLDRFHPAKSRVALLRERTPARFIAFDLVAVDGTSWMEEPFAARRAELERQVSGSGGVVGRTAITADLEQARRWLETLRGRGVDGVIAKARTLTYQPGRRAMVKVKREQTVDCVVGGFRLLGGEPMVSSLLLGLFAEHGSDHGSLRHVGVSSSFPRARRRELFELLSREAVPLEGHPWERGFGLGRSPIGRLPGSAGRWDPSEMSLDWAPIAPTRVCEVAYDQLDEQRFRHPARFLRWRPDRDARTCTFGQLAVLGAPLTEILP